MARHFMIFLTIILIYNYNQISIKCSDVSHKINTNGMIVYINAIKNIVQNASNTADDVINTEEKFRIGLRQIKSIHEELNNIIYNYDSVDKANVILHFEELDHDLEARYKKFSEEFFDIATNNVKEELYKKLSTEYGEKNHQDLKIIREEKLPNIKDESTVVFPKNSYENICDYNYALVKSHFYIYQLIIMLELRTFLTDTFIYLVYSYSHFGINKMKEHDKPMFDNYKNSMEQLQTNLNFYQDTLLKYARSFSTNDLYGCTPEAPIDEVTVRLLEKNHSAFELDRTSDKSHCSYEKCDFTVLQRDDSERFQLGKYHSDKSCYGTLTQCDSIDTVEFCYPSDSSLSNNKEKEYEGFKLNDEIYGSLTWCPKGKHTISVDRWTIKKCNECACRCPAYYSGKIDYKFHGKISFMEETSDIIDNLVVTDVKFVEINNTIHIQIEQGHLSKLKFNGIENEKKWKPLNFPWSVVEMSRVYKNRKFGHLIHGNRISYAEVHINSSILHLDDITLPPGHVVTGVKFGFKANESESIIQIQVRATPYDLITNELIIMNGYKETSFWITPESMDSSKMPEYKRKRTALLANAKTDSVPNQSILFQSFDSYDAVKQSIIPYFDSRMIFSKWPFPLSGIGISVKSYNGTKKYVTLKTFPNTIPPIN